MHLDPKCFSGKHKCSDVCVSVICRIKNPFVCSACNCLHKQESCNIMPFKVLVKQFHKIQGIFTNEMLKYEERIQTTFSQLMNALRKQFVKFREQFEYLNINQKISNVYDKIKAGKENELTGQIMHWAMKTGKRQGLNYKVKDELTMRLLKQEIIEIYAEVISRLPPYYSLKNIQEIQNGISEGNQIKHIEQKYIDNKKLTSGLMGQHYQYMQQIVNKEIHNIQLLYRATQSHFSASQFHKKCDGVTNTIVIAKTEFDRVVIGFCPFPWSSPEKWAYYEDSKKQCFLASTSKDLKDRKFTPHEAKFAIGMHKDYGPSFGDDFVIYDRANNTKNCWSNFPDVYICKIKPVEHNQKTIYNFIGVKDHFQKFNLKEWEVYKLSFSASDVLQNSWMKAYNGL